MNFDQIDFSDTLDKQDSKPSGGEPLPLIKGCLVEEKYVSKIIFSYIH